MQSEMTMQEVQLQSKKMRRMRATIRRMKMTMSLRMRSGSRNPSRTQVGMATMMKKVHSRLMEPIRIRMMTSGAATPAHHQAKPTATTTVRMLMQRRMTTTPTMVAIGMPRAATVIRMTTRAACTLTTNGSRAMTARVRVASLQTMMLARSLTKRKTITGTMAKATMAPLAKIAMMRMLIRRSSSSLRESASPRTRSRRGPWMDSETCPKLPRGSKRRRTATLMRRMTEHQPGPFMRNTSECRQPNIC
mmetsp:Transcript_69597/g.166978  ORF Transcript_69597/g.166978 Transcript_69597/m.166978 type:complete len:248 (-) Transcript_69597:42-785(-)